MAGILDKAKSEFSFKDVEDRKVEVRSVLSLAELERLVDQQVAERTAKLEAQVRDLQQRLSEAEAGDGGLERAAADAALEAEAAALEAKAAAEMRAEQAEAKVSELTARLNEAEAGGGGQEEVERLQGRVAELEAALAAAQQEAEAAKQEAEAAKQEAEAAQGAGEDQGGDAEPVTADDHSHARRLAEALLEDVFSEDEEKAKEAIAAGTFRETFASELETAYADYRRRVRPPVRAERDHWAEALEALEAEHKG